MKSRITLFVVLVVIAAQAAPAQSRRNRRGGALLGGLAGAAIGAAIGDKGNNETAGALIGGAVGAVAGGAIGDAKDREIDHNRAYHSGHHSNHFPQYHTGHHQPHYVAPGQTIYSPPVYNVEPIYPQTNVPYAPYPTPGANYVQPLTTHDVVTMVRSGLSEMMVIKQIHFRGMATPLRVSELIGLHQQGISEPILDAMQGN